MKIVINDIPPSNNQYMGKTYNYHQYQREKERWHLMIKSAIKTKPKKPFEKALVNIKYYFKDKRSRDPDNYSGKMLLDPLVREGILIDDSFKVVTLILAADHDKNNPRTEIDIKGV